MELPRWLVVLMLAASSLAILLAAYWWVTWPERTAHEFINLINAEQLTEARRHLGNEPIPLQVILRPRAEENFRGEPWTVEPLPRSVWDMIVGRQSFKKPSRSQPLVKTIAVEGTIVEVGKPSSGKVRFLNFAPFKSGSTDFYIVVFESDLRKFDGDLEKLYKGKKVRVTGKARSTREGSSSR